MSEWTEKNYMSLALFHATTDDIVQFMVESFDAARENFCPMVYVTASRDDNPENEAPIYGFWVFDQVDKSKEIYSLDSGIMVGMQQIPFSAFYFISEHRGDDSKEYIRIIGSTVNQWLAIADIPFTRDLDDGHYILHGDSAIKVYHPEVTKQFAPGPTVTQNPVEFLYLDQFFLGYVEAIHDAKYGQPIDKNDPLKYIEGRAK